MYTFDIFDTLLVRPWENPKRVFAVLGARLAEQKAVPNEERPEWVKQFVRARIEAEYRAYRETPGEHAPIREIYARFNFLSEQGFDVHSVMREEIALEESVLRAIPTQIRRVQALRARGEKVLYLSDMYLPAETLAGLLRKAGLDVGPEDVYVSGEVGKAKWRGKLFDHVAKDRGVAASTCHHTGDHPRSDGWMPRCRGWKATRYRESTYNRYEQAWAKLPHDDLREVADVSRFIRLTADSQHHESAYVRALISVAAPVLAMMAAHTLEVARRRDLARVYYIARDACIIRALAQRLARPGDPELRYLYGSRQAWFLATRDPGDFDGFAWLTPAGISAAVRDILMRVELGEDEARPVLESHGLWIEGRELTADEIIRLKRVLSEGELADLIRQKMARRREAFAAYLRQENFFDEGRVGTVDIGWFLNTHDALCRMVEGEGCSLDFDAIYLALVRRDPPGLKTAHLFPLLVEAEKPGRDARALLQNSLVFEMVFTPAPHGSTIGYHHAETSIKPTLSDAPGCIPVDAIEEIHALSARWLDEFLARGLPSETLCSPAFKQTALENLARFFMDPSREDIQALEPFSISSDANERRRKPVVNRITLAALFQYAWRNVLLRGKRGFFEREYFWLAASARRSSLPIRLAYEIIRIAGLYGSHLR